ncbi:TlpA family protein disulfide reductase [bacterium]|nr:TlpA family protein disulfide reductase [bacterium]
MTGIRHITRILAFLLLLAGTAAAQTSHTADLPDVDAESARAPAPAFVVASLDDSTSYLANESFSGQIVLLDFWATWCPPCVEALPALEKIYKEYHAKGFEILSLSFDSSDERIRRFRTKHFAMPWEHGRLAGGFGDVVSLSFGLQNIPHYVLIDRDGSIITEADELPPEELREILSAALD